MTTIETLRKELNEAAAEVACCIKFLESELGWEDFRSDGFIGRHTVSASTKNCQKLAAFLKDKGNHGARSLASFESILGPEIITGRAEQDFKWGGSGHDDEHEEHEWTDFMEKFMTRARVAGWFINHSGGHLKFSGGDPVTSRRL